MAERKITYKKRRLIIELLTDPSTLRISHRRVLACLSWLVLFAMVILNFFIVFKGLEKEINRDLIYTFAALCFGQSGLTVIGDKNSRSVKKEDEDDNADK